MAVLYSTTSKNAVQKTLTSILAAGNTTSAALSDVVGIPNLPGTMVIDRVNTANVATPSVREYIAYTGTSGSTVTGLTRNVDNGGTDQDHAVGAVVEFVPDVTWAGSIYTALSNLVNTSTLAVDTSKVVTPSSFLGTLNTNFASLATLTSKFYVNATFTGYVNFSGASVSGINTGTGGFNALFQVPGGLASVSNIGGLIPVPTTFTGQFMSAYVQTPASIASISVFILKNNSTYGVISIPAGGTFASSASISSAGLVAGDTLTMDIRSTASLSQYLSVLLRAS